ncbi:hypothetical protein [Acetobacter oeni]|uniref:Uncharacterized protein n=1 Tax=Acetobacter oeni TaxID=304077 RepID=A0A511XLR7_9PROT|nr:hypothetical protein [Acetobacter oeni]MBB3881852.1 hypothetical protein [Acetobacter oeni]NHO17821.1 hypothetical protein [Acetobacter oeni]GBR05328.1 hypothetical protein AA21952_1696 [Acetobacter oeni LMG 21952]GEN63895.1 hypothetical protein AOE01nite_21190 [Acetobacter oeni]
MSTMRELSVAELDEVSGGCRSFGGGGAGHSSCNPQPSCGSSTSLSGLIGAYAGYLAGMYNVAADYINGASCSTTASAWQNVATDMQIGYADTKGMSVSGAESFLQQTVAAIQGAQSYSGCGSLSLTTIAFPTNGTGALG